MWIKKTCIVLAGTLIPSLVTTSLVQAEDVKGSLSVLYSPHKTDLSAPGYLVHLGQLGKDHENKGDEYYGFQGEVNYGKYLLSIDYLSGTSNTIEGALDVYTPNLSPPDFKPDSFNPLSYESSETLDISAGYSIVGSGSGDKLAATVGYFRMWASPAISPPNWYDGLEFGLKGKYSLHKSLVLTGRFGYVPDVSVHGYMEDSNLMTGKYLVNYAVGAEVPLGADMSIVGGYKSLRAVNRVVYDGSDAVVKFTGFYVGGSYNF
ncbi:MAG: hypothetical protein ACOYOE_03370 [Chlorobium sp.]